MGIFLKIVTWLRKDGAAILGALTAVVKALRELIICTIRLLAILMPDRFVEETLIAKLSLIFDTVDGIIQKGISFLLSIGG